jgi:hypothetical protein
MREAGGIQKGPLQNSGVCRRQEEYKRGCFKTVAYVGGSSNTKGTASKQWRMWEAAAIQKGRFRHLSSEIGVLHSSYIPHNLSYGMAVTLPWPPAHAYFSKQPMHTPTQHFLPTNSYGGPSKMSREPINVGKIHYLLPKTLCLMAYSA